MIIGYVASQQFNHGVLQCPGLVLYQELEVVLVSDQVIQVMREYQEWHLIMKVVHCRLNLICSVTLPAVRNEYENFGTCSQALYAVWFLERMLFLHVKALRLSTHAAFAATEERSFSSSRRLKS